MLPVKKRYVLDEDQRPIAVQIAIEDFEKLEDLIENYGLAQLINENQGEERLQKSAALEYYRSLKREDVDS
ncbi:hypothetical protein IQ266_23095 [filamentous cyanobacterium LEGE 11480]|uniref:Uncharacterized protein n=1 Tax=Romeriopsis navalis LEGE 11480 TaxID=2777977 RepID=A0A928Z5A7_9CYAN|nr:hypothetical protein [Romeriopsis navalis]MBE9032629.1 hypothetical protein [Romeriopsis navalis LEGE 11480]